MHGSSENFPIQNFRTQRIQRRRGVERRGVSTLATSAPTTLFTSMIPLPDRIAAARTDTLRLMHAQTSGDEVADAFVTGEPDALRRVYDEHQRAVHSYCRRFVPEHAADITQEVFLGAWRSRERFDPANGSMAGWLMGIARFKVLDHLRGRYRNQSVAVGDMVDLTATDDPRTDEDPDIELVAARILVTEALDDLGDPAASWIRAAFMEGLSHTEIAERTGTPLGTVKSTIRRGMERIRRDLETFDADF